MSALGTLGTREDSFMSAYGTLGTREDSGHFSVWYPGASRGLSQLQVPWRLGTSK